MRSVPNRVDALVAAGILRTWTHAYTWGMPQDIAERRCAEVESDLWEFTHDAACDGLPRSVQILARLAVGIPQDLAWRFEQGRIDAVRVLARVLTLAALAAVFSTFWTARSDGARTAYCISDQNPRRSRAERVVRCVDAFFGGPSSSARHAKSESVLARRREGL